MAAAFEGWEVEEASTGGCHRTPAEWEANRPAGHWHTARRPV